MKPAYIITIVEPPIDNKVDLAYRIKKGIQVAKRNGYDSVYIIESDDYYPENYFELMPLGDFDIIGYQNTIYYNVRNNTYSHLHHESHSSLFCTAFKISAFEDFGWDSTPDDLLFLDIVLWKYAKRAGLNWKLLRDENPCLGIKHNMGKVGGKGHKMILDHSDNDLSFLKRKVDSEAFEFYKTVKELI